MKLAEDVAWELRKQAGRQHLPLGGPPRRDRFEGPALVCVGVAGHRFPGHGLLIRRHLATGELAFDYCYVPEARPVSKARLIRAAGLRWPVEVDFAFGKDCFGLDQSQVRLCTALARHAVLVMAALAACAVTAALLRDRTDTQALPPARPDQPPPADLGMIPLTIPEITRLLATRPARWPGHAEHWSHSRRRHQARSRWYHQRTRLTRGIALVS